MVSPTSFFLNLENKRVQEKKKIVQLEKKMHRLAVDFYYKLYSTKNKDEKNQN